MKKTIHTLSTLGCSRKKPNRGGEYGYEYEDMEFPGVSKKYHVEFPGVTKKKLCGIFRGLGFWSWNFQGMGCTFSQFPGVN